MATKEELDALNAELQLPADPVSGAEGQKLQSGAAALAAAPPIPVPGVQVAQAQPVVMNDSDPGYGAALDAILATPPQVEAAPAAEPSALPDFGGALDAALAEPLDPTLAAAQPESLTGIPGALGRGLDTGLRQMQAVPAQVGGVLSSYQGDAAGQAEAAQEAAKILQMAPQAKAPDFTYIHDIDSLMTYLGESVGQAAPQLVGTMLTGLGVGAGVKKGLEKVVTDPRVVAKISGFIGGTAGAAVNLPMEAGGAGQEFYEKTGDFQWKSSLAVGGVNSALEWVVPNYALKAVKDKAKSVIGTAAETALLGGVTEGTQELNQILHLAALDTDTNYWTKETAIRVADATLRGGVAEGAFGGAVKGVGKLAGVETRDPSEPEETWGDVLTYMRKRFARKPEQVTDDVLAPGSYGADFAETSKVFAGIRRGYDQIGINQANAARVADFEDAMTPRYVYKRADGSMSEVLTDTDLEAELATQAQSIKPEIYQVDLKSMNPAGVTAEVFDLPVSSNDPRIFFSPRVGKQKQLELLDRYVKLGAQVELSQAAKLGTKAERDLAKAALMPEYQQLVAEGLRVIPSRGSSFIFKGQLVGQKAEAPTTTGRTRVVVRVPKKSLMYSEPGVFTLPQDDTLWHKGKQPEVGGYDVVAIDANKVNFEDVNTIPRTGSKPSKDQIWFRKDVPEAQKDLLYRSFLQANQAIDAQRLSQLRKAGVQIKPQFAASITANDANFKRKLTRGVATPGETAATRTNADKVEVHRETIRQQWNTKQGGLVDSSRLGLTQNPQIAALWNPLKGFVSKVAKDLNEIGKTLNLPGDIQLQVLWDAPSGPWGDVGNGTIGLPLKQMTEQGMFPNPMLAGDIESQKAKFLQIALHEFGHLVTLWHYHKLPLEVKQRLQSAYDKARMDFSLTGRTRKSEYYDDLTVDQHQAGYSLTYSEWLAEQFRRAATQKFVLSHEGAFFNVVADAQKKIAASWAEKFSAQEVQDMLEPSWEFSAALEYIEKMDVASQEAYEGKAALASGISLPSYIGAVEHSELYKQTVDLVQQWRVALPQGTQVEVNPGFGPGGSPGAFVSNDPLTGKDTLRLWVGSMERRGSQSTVAHEALHAVWHLLSAGERQTLIAAGKAAKVFGPDMARRYYSSYKQQYLKLGLNEQDAVEAAKWEVDQEYAAWLIGQRFNGQDLGGANSILDSLIDLFAKVKNALLGRGWNSAESLSIALRKGEIARRKAAEAKRERLPVNRSVFGGIKDKITAKVKNRLPVEAIQAYEQASDFDSFISTRFTSSEGDSVTLAEATKLFAKWKAKGEYKLRQELVDRGYRVAAMAGTTRVIGLRLSDAAQVLEKQVKGQAKPEVQAPTGAANDQGFGIVRNQLTDRSRISVDIPEDSAVYLRPGPMPGTAVIQSSMWPEDDGTPSRAHFYLLKWDGKIPATRDPYETAMQMMQKSPAFAVIEVVNRGTKGFEVDYVTIKDNFGYKATGVPYVDKFYDFVFKNVLKTEPRPSGILYDDGYRMWKRRDPASVAWHQPDPLTLNKDGSVSRENTQWYSPNKLKYLTELANQNVDAEAAARGIARNLTRSYSDYQRTKRMLDKVPAEYWSDPISLKAFVAEPTANAVQHEIQLGEAQKGLELQDRQLETAVTGEDVGSTTSDYDQITAAELETSPTKTPEPMVSRMALGRYGEQNPEVRRQINGIFTDMDKVSWFSRLFFSIKQLAWRNQHITQLNEYTAFVDEMSAFRMAWIQRASDTVKIWDKFAPAGWTARKIEEQKTRLNNMLFWATEMRYLQPNEKPRYPTQQELAAYMQRERVAPETFQLYQRIDGDFQLFLNEVERVMAENIQSRNTTQGPTGALVLSQAGQAALLKLQTDMAALRKKPYFPMVRFGEWTITVRDPATQDKVVYFEAFASQRERDAAVRLVRSAYRTENIQIGRIQPDVMEFQGLPKPILEALLAEARTPGGPFQLTPAQIDWLESFSEQMAPEASFKKRWLKRQGTPGYSLDAMRVYSQYFNSGSSYLARMAYAPKLSDEIKALRSTLRTVADTKKRGQIVQMVEEHYNYLMKPANDWVKFRAAVTLWQLGFSPAAAFVNLTQTATFTLPYLSGIYGARAYGLMSEIGKSTKRAAMYSPSRADPQFAVARALLVQMGKLETGAAPELAAYSQGGNLISSRAGTRAQRAARSLMRTSMWMFEQAERINRELAFGLSWELSAQTGHPHLQAIEQNFFHEITRLTTARIDIGNGQVVSPSWDTAVRIIAARETISRTQFEYGREYRAKFMRNPLAQSFLVFYAYTQSALYAFGNNPGAVQLFLTYALLFGAMGLPGAEDLDEVLKAIARKMFGKDFSLEDKARELVRELVQGTPFEETGIDLALHGISRYSFGPGLLQEGFGIPQFDASANGSMGQVIPGLAETARAVGRGDDWKSVTAELARDVAGAGFGQIFPMLQALSSGFPSDDWKKWESVLPRSVKAMSKAFRYGTEGQETGKMGETVVSFDVSDPDDLATIVAQGFGFTPTKLKQKYDLVGAQIDKGTFYTNQRGALMAQFYDTVVKKDPEAKAEVVKRIKEFNAGLRAEGIPSLSITPDGLKQSMMNRFRTQQARESNLPNQKSLIPLYRGVEQLFPQQSEKVK